MGTWESFRTLEILELDCRGQNTSPWGVLHIIGKLPKCRCRRLQHKLSTKKGSRVKLTVWLPTTNSQESTRPRRLQGECNTPLESCQGELQVCFRPHPNRRFEQKVMTSQSFGSPNRDSFGTPLWESQEKKPFGRGCGGVTQIILYGGRWWLPPRPSRGESCESKVARGLF
jgi:hypothetical protein